MAETLAFLLVAMITIIQLDLEAPLTQINAPKAIFFILSFIAELL